jgi:hypothetical protein
MKIKNITHRNVEIKKQLKAIAVIISFVFIIISVSGCSIFDMIIESYTGVVEIPEAPDIEIDDADISEIGKDGVDIRKSYDVDNEIGTMDESLRDPFRPFYITDEETGEKNALKVEKIFTKDAVEYVEINFNNYTYKLKEEDTLSDTYLVQAINVNSVVLLKGDEILTLFLDIPIYD